MNNINNINPWIGLDSYEEGQTIYGRDNETISLSNWIIEHTQSILCGRSGIGKTSLLNAGVIPVLRRNNFFPITIRLEHNSISYIEQIRNSVFKETKKTKSNVADCNELVKVIDKDTETLWEFLHRYMFYDTSHNRIFPVIIFDQFEEIFTIEKNKEKIYDFFNELADLLNGITPRYIIELQNDIEVKTNEQRVDGYGIINMPDIPDCAPNYLKTSDFRIVITLRDDCLSCLEQYIKNIPSLKQDIYFLQPIDGDEALSVIMKPRPGLINEEVALKIISTINEDSEINRNNLKDVYVDSAILSLCLSQLFINKPIQEECITLSLVEQFNHYIIDNFYSESIRDIPIEIIEHLEDILVNDDCKRECVSLYTLQRNIPDIYLNILINERKLLRKFTRNKQAIVEYIHDILCPVVLKHKQIRKLDVQRNEDKIINDTIKKIKESNFQMQ